MICECSCHMEVIVYVKYGDLGTEPLEHADIYWCSFCGRVYVLGQTVSKQFEPDNIIYTEEVMSDE